MVSKLYFHVSEYPYESRHDWLQRTIGPRKAKYHLLEKIMVKAKLELGALDHPIWVDWG